jgi:hypothetical protein
MSGGIPLLPLCAFMAWTGKFTILGDFERNKKMVVILMGVIKRNVEM